MIRYATMQDSLGIASIHVNCWRESYSGIVDKNYLNNMRVIDKKKEWEKLIKSSEISVLVKEGDNEIIGFISYGKNRDEDIRGNDDIAEIYGFYIAKAYRHQGIGKSLFNKCIQDLYTKKYSRVMLWTFTLGKSIGIYRHLGGEEINKSSRMISNKVYSITMMRWEL